MTGRWSALLRLAAASTLAAVVAGCANATLTIGATPTADARAKAARIFHYQSAIANAAIDLEMQSLVAGEAVDPDLTAAQDNMMAACLPLTSAALEAMEGRSLGLGARLRTYASLDDCEHAARDLELEMNVGIAGL